MQLVLASTSPRRKELLALLGVSFQVCPPSFEEHPIAGLSSREQVARFAAEKAGSVAVAYPSALVLGADTVIEIDGHLLGKPADMREARTMLMALAGRAHDVHTAVAGRIHSRDMARVEVATARVFMRRDPVVLARYLETKESLGKAGAYSIQGAGGDLIDRIEGDFTTVVGLPLKVAADLLVSMGCSVPAHVETIYRQKPYPNWDRFGA